MQYLLLIYGDESGRDPATEEERSAELVRWRLVTEEMKAAGVLLGGEALMPVATATTVRVRDGQALTTDGPFAETKEQLGGFYFLECADADEALAWARKLPNVSYGSVEVRPVMHFPEEG